MTTSGDGRGPLAAMGEGRRAVGTVPEAHATFTHAVPAPRATPARMVRETLLLAGRSLRTIPRVPERLVDVTLQPAIFIVLFVYVFGRAIQVPGGVYQNFLVPGILAQQLAFSMVGTGTATCADMAAGVVDRFRSLPIARLSVITGQVIGQFCEALLGVVVVAVLGLVVGWTPHISPGDGLALVGLILLALFAATWAGVLMGMLFTSPDAVQGIGFSIVFPLSFLSGVFVPISTMAAVPQAIAEWSPISPLVASVRQLTGGVGGNGGGSWPLEHPIAATVIWSVVGIAVCVPLALRRFRKVTAA